MVGKHKDKILNLITSLKWQLAMLSTVLFATGVLSENGWITFVLSITGLRVVNEVTDMMTARKKDKANVQKK